VLSDLRFSPRPVRTVALPREAVGSSLTVDGRYLLVADGTDGATVLNVARLEAGAAHPVLGTLTEPGRQHFGGAIEVTGSPDGRYAFVSLEDADQVAVYNLHAALSNGFRRSSYVGAIHLGQAVVGSAVSPDGRWLYATSESAADATAARPDGTLTVINLRTAERRPGRSLVATIAAHCSPVRVIVSADGSVVWVTARESDQLLAFSAAKLRSAPGDALIAAVRVGESPVGLALVDHGERVVVADSDRFDIRGVRPGLTVVSVAAALAHHKAVLGTISAGAFPREMALEPNEQTLLVSNFGSDQVEAVAVSQLH
jgi:DNA-binding beta-propeller fold protein YncE